MRGGGPGRAPLARRGLGAGRLVRLAGLLLALVAGALHHAPLGRRGARARRAAFTPAHAHTHEHLSRIDMRAVTDQRKANLDFSVILHEFFTPGRLVKLDGLDLQNLKLLRKVSIMVCYFSISKDILE